MLALLPLLPALHIAAPVARVRSAPRMAASDIAILFDCDGVLADTERDGHRVSFNKVFGEKELGFEWEVEEYGRLCEIGGGCARHLRRGSPIAIVRASPAEATATMLRSNTKVAALSCHLVFGLPPSLSRASVPVPSAARSE